MYPSRGFERSRRKPGRGISGNHAHVNSNRVLIQEFVEVNQRKMVNADPLVTKEMFTRIGGGYATVLDYVLTSPGAASIARN